MSIMEIESKLQERQELRRMAEELQSEIEQIEDEIKNEMGDREQMVAGMFRVSWKTVESSRLDGKKLKAELPEIADRFMVRTSVRRFSVA